MKIALMQLSPAADQASATIEGAEACRQAKAAGAELALFPEIWSHGYRFFDPDQSGSRLQWERSALSLEGEFVRDFRLLAKELGMAIGLGYLQETRGQPRNSFVLIDRTGHDVLHYSKVHTCLHTLERYCEHGTELTVTDLNTAEGSVRVGAMICYDREHPETARVLALKGAELVLVPNACVLDDLRVAQIRVRAFENKFAIAMTNYPSSAGHSNGRSMGISAIAYRNAAGTDTSESPEQSEPVENRLAEAGPDPGIYYFDLDLPAEREYRKRAIWGPPHRRPESYGTIVEPNAQVGNAIDDPIS